LQPGPARVQISAPRSNGARRSSVMAWSRTSFLAAAAAASALAGESASAASYPGNQGKTWEDIAKLPPITGIYEANPRLYPQKDGQRDLLPVFTPKAAAEKAAYEA